jgi:DNA ligase-1
MPFQERVNQARLRCIEMDDPRVVWIPHVQITTLGAMEAFEASAVNDNFEGIMLRDPTGRYKYGRSTVKENLLLKVKRFITEEATITALEEQVENLTASTVDALGRAKKSTSKDTQVGTGMVGAFVVESPKWPTAFRISASSLSHKDRKAAWENQGVYLQQLARFKYCPPGVVDVPRHGVFEAIRGREDL